MDGAVPRGSVGRILFIWLCASAMSVCAADVGGLERSMREDAALRAITFVDAARGWAVGDRGVMWRTTDGGQSWQLQTSGCDAALGCVYFIDIDNGWVAGGEHRPHLASTKG